MDIYVVQNLTDRKLSFQGKTIGPYATEEYLGIFDYATLSKLFNSNMIYYSTRYVQPKKPVAINTAKEKVEEPVVEKVDKTVEPAAEEEITEVAEAKEEKVVEEPKETKPYTSKKNKRNPKEEK